jgi:epsilon-lactone hydrolase
MEMRKGKLNVPHPHTPPQGGAISRLATLDITRGTVIQWANCGFRMNTQIQSTLTSVDSVVARVKKVYASWTRETTVEQMRRDWDEMFWSDAFPATSKQVSANGVDACWVDAPDVDPQKALLYFHGGGFRVGSVRSHRDLIARISAASGCRALGVNFRLAPEHHFPAPLEDAVTAYRWLLAQGFKPENIALVGDSAGGNLVLTSMLSLRAQGLPLPAAAAVMSVWTDLTASGDSYTTRASADPIHQRKMILGMAKGYLGESGSAQDPLVSPLFADLHGLPPLMLQVGDRETVLDDSKNFAAKARAAGIEVELEVWDNMIHVFQQFTADLPEALLAMKSIGRFLRKYQSLS